MCKNKNEKKEIGNNQGWANRGEQQTKGGGNEMKGSGTRREGNDDDEENKNKICNLVLSTN
jgi:hypothetical protein